MVCPEYRCSCSVFQVHSCFLLLEAHSSFHFPCSVYLWNASTASVNRLCDLGDSGDTVTSVSWAERVREARAACVICLSASTQGTHLAVGSSSGMVQIWDVTKSRVIRELAGHRQRVRGLQKSEKRAQCPPRCAPSLGIGNCSRADRVTDRSCIATHAWLSRSVATLGTSKRCAACAGRLTVAIWPPEATTIDCSCGTPYRTRSPCTS